MGRKTQRKIRERGAALVEAAFVMPIILLLTFGVWTVARAWQVHNTIDHAVREAARFGSTIDPWDPATSPSAIRNVLDTELSAGSIPTGSVATICIDRTTSGVTPGVCGSPSIPNAPSGTENIVVRVRWSNYQMNYLFFQQTVNLTGSAVSRWED